MHRLNSYTPKERLLKKFLVFADCIFVKGKSRSAVYDLGRNDYKLIPNSLLDLVKDFEGYSLSEIQKAYGEENKAILMQYFSFLEDMEYIFWCDEEEKKLFPKLNMEWDYPAKITNAIIDIADNSKHDFGKVFSQLESLGCCHIQIRSFTEKTINFWIDILEQLSETTIKKIEIITKYTAEYNIAILQEIYDANLRLHSFIIHSSPTHSFKQKSKYQKRILFVKERIESNNDCHKIHPSYFSVNVQLFTEAQHYHTYFNRKLSIDIDGSIKNCNSLEQSFGNIKDTKLIDVVLQKEFQALWSITKDQTKICKDCEFRYMCIDSRQPIKDKDGLFYHKHVCPYNPSTVQWNHIDD